MNLALHTPCNPPARKSQCQKALDEIVLRLRILELNYIGQPPIPQDLIEFLPLHEFGTNDLLGYVIDPASVPAP